MVFKVVTEKETYLSTFFIDLEERVSFAYVPVRDQNLVVQGKNWCLICFCVFLLVLKKKFERKSQAAKWICLCFFILRENDLKYD